MGVLRGKHLTGAEVCKLAYDAGVRGHTNLVNAVAVAYGESRFWTEALNINSKSGDKSYGLWQINMIGALGPARRKAFGLKKDSDLYNPKTNARAMFKISSGGKNWKPWGAYTNGGFKLDLKGSNAEVVVTKFEYDMAHPVKRNPVSKAVKVVKNVVKPLPWVSHEQVYWAATHPAVAERAQKPGNNNSMDDVRYVQAALVKLVGLKGHAPGIFDVTTQNAYDNFRRTKLGLTGESAKGAPGEWSIKKLAELSKVFRVRDFVTKTKPAVKVVSPVPGHKVTYPYGVKNSRYAAGFHTGDDYAAATGIPVVAVRGGTIRWSNSGGGAYGNWIGLAADNGRVYVYCHLSSRQVSVGQKVKAGQQIGRVGATGNVTGPHLHFEDHPTGSFVYGKVRKPSW